MIESLARLVGPLASALRPRAEVVVHDLSKMPSSIAAVGGSVTGRRDGGPGSDLLLKMLRQNRFEDIIGYESVGTSGERLLSSSIFVRNNEGLPIACLCINTDISDVILAKDLLESLSAITVKSSPKISTRTDRTVDTSEHFAQSVEELTDRLLEQALKVADTPINRMGKAEKICVIEVLEKGGFFLLRDAVGIAASRLGITRYTVYNYLNEIRDNPSK